MPEVAARAHLRWIVPALDEALGTAGVTIPDVDAVAVTYGPGLAGSLLVGINVAKTLAWAHDKPLVPVNHLEGHVYAGWLLDPGEAEHEAPPFPLVALVVSGGHTFLVEMRDHLDYRLLGQTVDDAAGEAFDKVGRLLGLGYPGGPAISRAAEGGEGEGPRRSRGRGFRRPYDLSFSGLKTAARRIVGQARADEGLPADERDGSLPDPVVAELAWGFQDSVVDVLTTKTIRAAEEVGARGIVLGGGVAANSALRARLAGEAEARGHPARRSATRPVHRQRGDDRRGGRPAARGGGAGRARPRRAAVAAARPMSPADLRLDPRYVRRDAPRRPASARATGWARTSSPTSTCSRGSCARPTPRRGDRVLEIGPGLGFLTGGLLAAGAAVTAVELDRGMARVPARHVRRSRSRRARLRLIEGDALDQDLVGLVTPPYDVVANLPYHITSPVLHRLLGRAPRAERLVLMLQREVAERVARRAGRDVATCRCSSSTTPRPGSRSACRARRSSPRRRSSRPCSCSSPIPPTTGSTRRPRTHLWRVVQAGFRERRKMLHNVLDPPAAVRARSRGRRAGRRRDRARPPAPDRRGGGVDRARRGARPDPGGPVTPGARR